MALNKFKRIRLMPLHLKGLNNFILRCQNIYGKILENSSACVI